MEKNEGYVTLIITKFGMIGGASEVIPINDETRPFLELFMENFMKWKKGEFKK